MEHSERTFNIVDILLVGIHNILIACQLLLLCSMSPSL
jgi:hypothetical protein